MTRDLLAPVTRQQATDFLEDLANLRPDKAALKNRFIRKFSRFIPVQQTAGTAVETAPFRDRQRALEEAGVAPPVDSPDANKLARRTRRRMAYGEAPLAREDGEIAETIPDVSVPPDRSQDTEAAHDWHPARRLGPLRRLGPEEQGANHVWRLRQLLRHVWDQPDKRTREWGIFLLLLTTRGEAGSGHITLLGFPGPLPPPTPFEEALLHFVDIGDRARHCQNPECAAPYFFAARRSQKYCSGDCARPAQQESKKRWWDEHGSEWRKTRQQSRRGTKKR